MHRTTGRRRRAVLLGAGALLAAAIGAGLVIRGATAPAAAGTGSSSMARIPTLAAPRRSSSADPIDGIRAGTGEQLAFHVHAHLAVYVNGRPEVVPHGIGVLPPLELEQTPEGPFVVGGAAFYWLHTHDDSGVIHIESPVVRRFTLGEFFDVWGQPLGPHRVGPVRGPVTALVDGRPVPGDPRDIPLDAHSVIQLDVGSVVPFRPFAFPPGL